MAVKPNRQWTTGRGGAPQSRSTPPAARRAASSRAAGSPVLHDVTFESRPGTVTALVGSSGSGKSTIIGLVTAFHDPSEGGVRVDGKDLAAVRLDTFRTTERPVNPLRMS